MNDFIILEKKYCLYSSGKLIRLPYSFIRKDGGEG